jgi:filamentous hemagglutinin
MEGTDFHAFPEIVRNYAGSGKISVIRGGDGVARTLLRIPGSYRGRQGIFEFIKEPDGMINHRLFTPD